MQAGRLPCQPSDETGGGVHDLPSVPRDQDRLRELSLRV